MKNNFKRFAGKGFSLLLMISVVFISANRSRSDGLILSKSGKALYSIVLPDLPTAVESTAAKELKKYLDEITGAGFAIVNESDADNTRPQIVVGNSLRAKELLPEVDAAKLPYDGIVIETAGKNIILTGHPVRGTLYAVNTFLEDAAGVRWWTSTESFVPQNRKLTVPQLHVHYAPSLIYREAFYRDAFHDEMFASRMKCNGDFARISPGYGDCHKFQYFVHSFYPILPPATYFDSHPEWYSLVDGKRTFQHAQLCLSNEEMRRQFITNALATLHENPDAGFISISQNDCHGACQCEQCQAIVREEGSEAGPLIRFVNSVAEAIEGEFPDVWVETLAYQYTRKAPLKVKPRNNVVIRLCSIECSFSQPLGEGEQNRSFREDMEAWSKIADHLFVWNYVTNFSSYMLPQPNLHTLADDIRFFVRNNTIGLFEQGDVYCDAGDFVRMRNWVVSRLMWNPELDENRLVDEFLTGYYGEKAAPHLRKYWDLLTAACKESGVYLRCYMHVTDGWLSVPAYAEAAGLMKQAIEATKDETLRNRLRREEIPLKYVLLLENERFKSYEKETGNLPLTLPESGKALDEFMALLKEFNVTMCREDFSENPNHIPELEQMLRNRLFPEQK
jgi:ferredoxin